MANEHKVADVTRYTCTTVLRNEPEVHECKMMPYSDGEYVSHTDYAALLGAKEAADEVVRHHETNDRCLKGFILPEADMPLTADGLKDHMEYSETCTCFVCDHTRMILGLLERTEKAEAAVEAAKLEGMQMAQDAVKGERRKDHGRMLSHGAQRETEEWPCAWAQAIKDAENAITAQMAVGIEQELKEPRP